MASRRHLLSLLAASFLLMLGSGSASRADDTEIFKPGPNITKAKPNILFLLDTSGSMSAEPKSNYFVPTPKRRIEILKDAMHTVLSRTSGVNVGLMRFSNDEGAAVLAPVRDIDADGSVDGKITVRATINDSGDDVQFTGDRISPSDRQLTINNGNIVGLRYSALAIPRHAVITRAYLDLGNLAVESGDLTVAIDAEDSGNALPYAEKRLSERKKVADKTVSWSINKPWQADAVYRSEDLKALIQAVVSREDWCGNNALSLLLSTGNSNVSRSVVSFDNNRSSGDDSSYLPVAPILTVEFDVAKTVNASSGSNKGCTSGQAASKIMSGADDGVEDKDGKVSLKDNELEIYEPEWSSRMHNKALGLRFTALAIPVGATIRSAQLSLINAAETSTSTSFKIAAVAAADAVEFGNNDTALSSLSTLAESSYSLPIVRADSSAQFDVTAQIAAAVAQAGWKADNAVALILKGDSGKGAFKAYEEGPGQSARLSVQYVLENQPYVAGMFKVRDAMSQEVKTMLSDGPTPSTEALYEAFNYMAGREVDYGLDRRGKHTVRVSTPASFAGEAKVERPADCLGSDSSDPACGTEKVVGTPSYKSPVTAQCQVNQIVLLSDGEPNSNAGIAAKIKAATGVECDDSEDGKDCAKKLATFMNTQADLNTNVPEKQRLTVNTIGFAMPKVLEDRRWVEAPGTRYLKDLAKAGGGTFYYADDKGSLVKALSDLINSSADVTGSFAAPAVSVNTENSLTHSDEVYFPVFKPTATVGWNGNLKRYRLAAKGNYHGEDGNVAVDAKTGNIMENAKSWWRTDDTPDGSDVRLGGAAGKLSNTRTVFSDVAGTDLSVATNRLNTNSTGLNPTDFGVADATELSALLAWIAGDDGTGQPRKSMGDPLHSRPVRVNYTVDGNSSSLVFVGTNEGYLHAIKTDNGEEAWSYIPKSLLPNLPKWKANASSEKRVYGVDGPITVHIAKDGNNNGIVDAGDRAYLYVGLRRGGSEYFALDISNPVQPLLMFRLKSGAAPANPEQKTVYLPELGQSWSRPVIATVRLGGKKQAVIVIGGGYDTKQDTDAGHVDDERGRTIYMLDAKTGDIVWDARRDFPSIAAQMTNSIPADVAVVDLSGKGYAEHMYVGDLGGKVFRFDINPEASSASNLVKGTSGVLAALQQDNSVANNRRFYYSPSLAYIKRKRIGRNFIAVSLGSGYREHPKNTTIDEHMYSLRDYGVLKGEAISTPITVSDLININDYQGDAKRADQGTGAQTDGANGRSDAVEELEWGDFTTVGAHSTKKGWYLPFGRAESGSRVAGEKVLARAFVFRNKLYFNTYLPATTNEDDKCSVSIGTGRSYAVDIVGGDAPGFLPDPSNDKDGKRDTVTFVHTDRFIALDTAGIPSEPYVVRIPAVEDDGGFKICTGTVCRDTEGVPRLNSYMWQQLEEAPPINASTP